MVGLVKECRKKYIDHPEIYYHDEVLIKTKEKRDVQLITITEKTNCTKDQEEPVEGLFP